MTAIDNVLSRLEGRRESKGGWMAKCPAHDDGNPSLSVREGDGGNVLLHCFSGCSIANVVAALDLTMRDLMSEDRGNHAPRPSFKKAPKGYVSVEKAEDAAVRIANKGMTAAWKITDRHIYKNPEGAEVMRVLRFEPAKRGEKRFLPLSPSGGGWILGDPAGILPLYHLPNLRHANRVLVFEGERCVEAAARLGYVATTSSHGAKSAAKTDWSPLAGLDVVIFPDNDEPGRRYVADVAKIVLALETPAQVRIVTLPGLEAGGDIVDFIVERKRDRLSDARIRNEIDGLIASAEAIKPLALSTQPRAADLVSFPSSFSSSHSAARTSPWPGPVAEDALHGLAGDFVRLVGPETESDMMALLVPFLAGIGNIVGRCCAYEVESTLHHPGLYVVAVGETAKGRKGTAWQQSKNLLRRVDPDWAKSCCSSGLSSGEGLIWAVRDPIEAFVNEGKRGDKQRVMRVVDAGVSDKRRFVYEGEFAQALRVLEREGNTLSPVIRSAWDGDTLQTLTKNSPAKATDPHISILGHGTKDEILRYLNRTELCNGFGNRFLWVCVRRSKLLPFGGEVPPGQLDDLAEKVRRAVAEARKRERLAFDLEARNLWAREYPRLSAGHRGLFGAATARAEPQVIRMATIYAILDGAKVITVIHLRAALAVWAYCEASARFVFGDASGDPIADRIIEALRAQPAGLNRTDIQKLFGNNKQADQLGRALQGLAEAGLAAMVKMPTDGRDKEVWRATKETNYTKEVVRPNQTEAMLLESRPTKETNETRKGATPSDLSSSISSNSLPDPAAQFGGDAVEEEF